MADGPTQASKKAKRSGADGPDPLIGRVINDRFKIVALIARGGMGKVYRAEQAPLGRTCALKVLNPKYSGDSDPEFHKRFFLEASISSKLTHPNTVTIFDYGRTDDDIYYMAMEYLEGRTLHRTIREEGPFSEERAAHIGRQICRSLREAHSLGVIHRDLKPANVFLVEHADERDFVKVLDFGLVKNVENKGEEELTKAGLFMGSPKYMAPEQIKGETVDARTDIYALGIILYEMLTGHVPFERQNSVHIMMAHVNEPPPPLREVNPNIEVSQAMEEVIMRCLEKDPDKRFSSMEEVLSALKVVGSGSMTATLSGVLSSGDFLAVTGTDATGGPATPGATGSGGGGNLSRSGDHSFLSNSSPSTSNQLVSPHALDSSETLSTGKGSKRMLAIAIAAVSVIALVGIFVLSNRGEEANTGTATTSASAKPPAIPGVASTEPTATSSAKTGPDAGKDAGGKEFTVRFETSPEGATAKDQNGTVLCESTPCSYKFHNVAKDEENKTRTVTFVKGGYRSSSKTFRVTDEVVKVKLVRVRSSHRPSPKPKATTPAGFKDIPY